MANEHVIEITNDNFENEVLGSDKPVLVDFWATWCGPCRMIAPLIDEIATEFSSKAKVGKVDVDVQSELAAKFNIMTIPTLIFFKDGKAVHKEIGVKSKQDLVSKINELM